MILLVLLLIILTLDTHSNSFVFTTGPNDFFGQAVDPSELEWESRVGMINSNSSQIIWSGSRSKWVRVRVKSGDD
jgi:hypothetical protein